jgi:uncharacterized RDD family membrane protein YckC
MRCPSCGTLHDASAQCETEVPSSDRLEVDSSTDDVTCEFELANQTTSKTRSESRLIEFPGSSRNAVPVWRKEIAERVREAQERKAREAALEESNKGQHDQAAPQLELLPQTAPTSLNPLVAAALKRIERAHMNAAPPAPNGARPRAAVAYATNYEPVIEPSPASAILAQSIPETLSSTQPLSDPEVVEPTRTSNLVVVPPVTVTEPREEPRSEVRTRRLISDDVNNPALNYLDSISTSVRLERSMRSASGVSRFLAGVIDLLLLALLTLPIAAGLELFQSNNPRNPQVIALAGAAILVIAFLYLTICTAFSGRTLGIRLAGLRIVDVRTGLIPTGSQSASRSLVYLISLLSAGLLFLGLLFDSDHRTPHERLSRTAVVKE